MRKYTLNPGFMAVLISLLLSMTLMVSAQEDDTPNQASIEVVKSASMDGGATWNNGDLPPGLVVEIGRAVSFLIQVSNTGDEPLSNIILTDTLSDLNDCAIPDILEVGGSFNCITDETTASEGQHMNSVTVSAEYDGIVYTDTDSAYYFAGELPKLSLEKLVTIADSGVWYAADTAPGLMVTPDDKVMFRFVVTNDGTEELTNITLTDSQYTIEGCEIPVALASGASFECLVGPFDVEDEGAWVNIATVTAVAGSETLTVSDEAHYQTGNVDDDGSVGIIIIIEGPVQEIIGNIIIIFNINIELNEDDPLLTVIHIGDIVRVEGEVGDDDDDNPNTIIVIAIVIIIIDVDIYIIDGLVWRDDSDCGNPPPAWAPAHGWRKKCEYNVIIIIGDGGSDGMGMGMGNDD